MSDFDSDDENAYFTINKAVISDNATARGYGVENIRFHDSKTFSSIDNLDENLTNISSAVDNLNYGSGGPTPVDDDINSQLRQAAAAALGYDFGDRNNNRGGRGSGNTVNNKDTNSNVNANIANNNSAAAARFRETERLKADIARRNAIRDADRDYQEKREREERNKREMIETTNKLQERIDKKLLDRGININSKSTQNLNFDASKALDGGSSMLNPGRSVSNVNNSTLLNSKHDVSKHFNTENQQQHHQRSIDINGVDDRSQFLLQAREERELKIQKEYKITENVVERTIWEGMEQNPLSDLNQNKALNRIKEEAKRREKENRVKYDKLDGGSGVGKEIKMKYKSAYTPGQQQSKPNTANATNTNYTINSYTHPKDQANLSSKGQKIQQHYDDDDDEYGNYYDENDKENYYTNGNYNDDIDMISNTGSKVSKGSNRYSETSRGRKKASEIENLRERNKVSEIENLRERNKP